MKTKDFTLLSEREIMYGITGKEEQLLNDISFDDFMKSLDGRTKHVALSVLELYKRDKLKKSPTKITSSRDAAELMAPLLCDSIVEQAWIIPMNQASGVVNKPVRISIGGLSQTLVDVRVVMKELLMLNATCFILAHNHPSGNLRPSLDDDRLTKRIKEASELMAIKMVDHIIMGKQEDEYFSYNDDGRF